MMWHLALKTRERIRRLLMKGRVVCDRLLQTSKKPPETSKEILIVLKGVEVILIFLDLIRALIGMHLVLNREDRRYKLKQDFRARMNDAPAMMASQIDKDVEIPQNQVWARACMAMGQQSRHHSRRDGRTDHKHEVKLVDESPAQLVRVLLPGLVAASILQREEEDMAVGLHTVWKLLRMPTVMGC